MKKIKSLNELVKSFKYDKKIGLVIDGNEIIKRIWIND